MSDRQTCLLCGNVGLDVQPGVVRWKQPHDGRPYAFMPRCRDHDACRGRVITNGDEWELAGGDFTKRRSDEGGLSL